MVRTELSQRFGVKDYFARRRALGREKELQKYMKAWKEEVEAKVWQADQAHLFARFTNASSTTTDGSYYSVSYDTENGVSIVIIDRDRTKRPGERCAMAIKDDSIIFLETVGRDGVKDPYEWEVVTDRGKVRDFLHLQFQSFKSTPLLRPGGEGVWRGYNHNREEILSVVPKDSGPSVQAMLTGTEAGQA